MDDLTFTGHGGMPYSLSDKEVLNVLENSDKRHPDAPADQCGVISPFEEDDIAPWCHRPLGSHNPHNRYPLDEDWPERAVTDPNWWTIAGQRTFY